MPSFMMLFMVSVVLTCLAAGPAGWAALGGLTCVWFFTPRGSLARLIVGALTIIVVGLPSLAIACMLWVVCYVVGVATGKIQIQKPDVELGRNGQPVVDAEFTEVRPGDLRREPSF